MGTSDRYSSSSTASIAPIKSYRNFTIAGWVLTIAGCIVWTVGYFITGSTSLLDWRSFSPTWISDYLPNWQSELGMLLACFGQVPIIYAQSRSL